MSADQIFGILVLLLTLVLVGSIVIGRRLPWHQTLRLALIWAAILVGLVAAIRFLGLA